MKKKSPFNMILTLCLVTSTLLQPMTLNNEWTFAGRASWRTSAVDSVNSGKFGADGDNLTWQYDSSHTLTIKGSGEMENWEGVARPWGLYQQYIESIVLENGVTNIGNSAFYHCDSLTSVTIPDSVTSIGNDAFSDCGIPDGLIQCALRTKYGRISVLSQKLRTFLVLCYSMS